MLTVLETSRVSPPPLTVGSKSLPLTFFDTLWLLLHPVHHLFFYDFPHSRAHFIEEIIPSLKHSLSVTLQHFFPFAGKLIMFPNQNLQKKPEIRYVEGDSVAVTFAECILDFNDLTGNHPRECGSFYPLVPELERPTKIFDYVSIPVFSVQVTLFPNSGIAIGFTNHHTLCDASTRFNFQKAWTSIAKHGTDELFLSSGSLPVYDRLIKYPNILDEIYLNQPGIQTLSSEYKPPKLDSHTDKVRATIFLTRIHMNQLKQWVSTQLPRLEYVSSFSVACAYVWSCIAKSRVRIGEKMGDDDLERFACAVDWRARFDPPVTQTYFGNCLGACITETTKTTILSENDGFLNAAELLGTAISQSVKSKNDVFKDAETWIERAFEPVPTIGVAGTPKLKIYDTDFGWGKPKKYETISIDYNSSISVNACKESPDDLEIGLSLPSKQMDAFIAISREQLERIVSERNE